MCTGVKLIGADGSAVCGRTMEWGAFDLSSRVVVVPRDLELQGATPNGEETGKRWTSTYGFVGLDALHRPFIADGLNEQGLACGAFYLPGFAEYAPFSEADAASTIGPLDVVHYLLSQCASVDDVANALDEASVAPVVNEELGFAPPLHYMTTDKSGTSLVIEYVDGGELNLYDNPLGVVTNAPEFDWHMTNLRNYLNLSAVEVPATELGDIELAPLGAGSGLHGLPGDNTPPSRFVRAVAHTQTARPTAGGFDTVKEVLRVLDQFQLAVGAAEGSDHGSGDVELPAATQWTTASDTRNLRFYYHTAWNRRLREVDLNAIDLTGAEVVVQPLDGSARDEDIEDVNPR